MVWRGVCGQQRADLIVIDGNLTAHRYINHIFTPRSVTSILFQQDNVRSLTARVVQQFFAANNVNVSPDLSPVEHVWDHLGQLILIVVLIPNERGSVGTGTEA